MGNIWQYLKNLLGIILAFRRGALAFLKYQWKHSFFLSSFLHRHPRRRRHSATMASTVGSLGLPSTFDGIRTCFEARQSVSEARTSFEHPQRAGSTSRKHMVGLSRRNTERKSSFSTFLWLLRFFVVFQTFVFRIDRNMKNTMRYDKYDRIWSKNGEK